MGSAHPQYLPSVLGSLHPNICPQCLGRGSWGAYPQHLGSQVTSSPSTHLTTLLLLLYLFPISVLYSSSMWMPSVPSPVLQQKGKYNHGFVVRSMGQSVRTYCRYFLRHVTPCQLERVQRIDAEPRKSKQENPLESDTNVQERADACIMRLPFLILSLLFHPPTILNSYC